MKLRAIPSRLSLLARRALGNEDFLPTDAACRKRQEESFARLGLDYAASKRRLDAVLKELGAPAFDEASDSQHWVLFAGLSLARPGVKAILEIGTFDGAFTRLLSGLFPAAAITTMDLADDDPIVATMYGRHERAVLESVIARRRANLASAKARFLQKNSFFLPKLVTEPQDLIWIDGDHAFPALAWDFCNSYFALGEGGLMACDDVFLAPGRALGPKAHPKMMHDYLAGSGILSVDAILKRVTAANASDPRSRKSVTVLKKP